MRDHPPVLAIDPGPTASAYVLLDRGVPNSYGYAQNDHLLGMLHDPHWDTSSANGSLHLAIESMVSYGMPVGQPVLATCVWIGRFMEAHGGEDFTSLISRQEVKNALCDGNMKAKNSNVRRACLDWFPQSGGGATPEIGTQKQPGPLWGFRCEDSTHLFAALAIAVTWIETRPAAGEEA